MPKKGCVFFNSGKQQSVRSGVGNSMFSCDGVGQSLRLMHSGENMFLNNANSFLQPFPFNLEADKVAIYKLLNKRQEKYITEKEIRK